jgi:hypothetical protein
VENFVRFFGPLPLTCLSDIRTTRPTVQRRLVRAVVALSGQMVIQPWRGVAIVAGRISILPHRGVAILSTVAGTIDTQALLFLSLPLGS